MKYLKYSDINDNYIFHELTDYYVEFDTAVTEHAEGDNSVIRWINPNLAKINFGNSIGKSNLMGKLINVTSKKISMERYEEMLLELTDVLAKLPFDFNKPTYEDAVIDTSVVNSITYHTFLVLKYIILNTEANLEGAFESIFKNPSKKNELQDVECNVWEASDLSSKTIMSIFNNPQNLVSIQGNPSLRNTSIAKILNGEEDTFFFPAKVIQSRVVNSMDTPENRFIKHFLKSCHERLHNFRALFNDINCFNKIGIEHDIRSMNEIIEELQSNYFFDEIGEITAVPFNSTILQKRSGYKEVRYFYDLLQSSIKYPILEEKLKLIIENKDVSELYEMWTYFKVIETTESLTGISPDKIKLIRENEFKAYLQKGIGIVFEIESREIKIWYNKTYGCKCGSYSLPLRPDIAVDIDGELYIFDAKFKLESLNLNKIEDEKDFTFKNGDIYKMHTYKDAIKGVKFAGILYPNPNNNEADIFWENQYEMLGIGAIPLAPGLESKSLKEVLIKVLAKYKNIII